MKEHIKDSRKDNVKGRPLYRAINKYGKENFQIELLGEFEEGILEEKEIEFIKLYNTYHNGYNATLGGDGKRYFNFSDKEVIDYYLSGMTIKDTAHHFCCCRDMISLILKNNNIQIRDCSKEIFQYGLDGNFIQKFNSIKLASEWVSNNTDSIADFKTLRTGLARAANKERKTAYHFIWEWN